MLRMRFWPMTARPMSAMSAFGSMFGFSKETVTIQKRAARARSFLWAAGTPLSLLVGLEARRAGRQGKGPGTSISELQARVGFQQRLEIRPAGLIHFVKGMEIDRHHLG